MKIKSFYAESMDQALHAASKELGDEALILNTRETPVEFRHFGKYEVVCACATPVVTNTGAVQAVAPVAAALPVLNIPAVRETIALVGPSGAGKSTSCAKIAIRSKFTDGRNPAVLTWDVSHVGAANFLRSYCEISGIPFREVENGADFANALVELQGHDLLVIDTPAVDANAATAKAMAEALRSAPNLKVHLVISGAYSTLYLANTLERHAIFEPAYLLPTHLDDSTLDLKSPGLELLSQLRIEWCGTGRSVPEDLEASAQVLARAAEIPVEAATEAIVPSAEPIVAAPAVRYAVEQILSRFRHHEISPDTHLIRSSTQSAA